MNTSLWIQYGIIVALVLLAMYSLLRRIRQSRKQGGCASGCSSCSGSCDSGNAQAVIQLKHHRHHRSKAGH